jgi:DNA (cytosine-5)-methyltransferase 1
MKLNYKWYLRDGYVNKKNGFKVFGTFVCGGGSTMGYKLAGFEHIGGVEFAEHYAEMYKTNHNPKHFFVEDIRDFNKRQDLPEELYNIDLLDGSPPCASFSTCGAREKKWGKEKLYEGKMQKTDDLVFEYIKTIKKLKPKTFIMENVSGLIKGNAKAYVRKIFEELDKIGYRRQIFLLNAASMGVPQMRERVFIIGSRKGLDYKPLKLNFNEKVISFKEATEEFWGMGGMDIKKYALYKYWKKINYPKETSTSMRFNLHRPKLHKPCNTLVESCSNPGAAGVCHPLQPRKLNKYEASAIQSYPLDYNFLEQNPLSCIGRSVPPVMMAMLSNEIYKQWLGVD